MIILILLAFSSLYSKTDYFHSQPNLSTLFFDSHISISIISKSNTYIFLNSPTPRCISYSIMQNTDYNKSKIIKNKGKIQNENEFIRISNASYLQAYFNFDKKSIKTCHKFLATSKVSSISFLSYDLENICQNGFEFIQSEKEYHLKMGLKKCFYLPPYNNKEAVLYSDEKVFISSLNQGTLSVQNKMFINKLSKKNEEISHSKLLSSQDSQNSKNSKLLIELVNNSHSCKYGKKYMAIKRSVFSIVNSNSFIIIIIIILSAIFLISICVGKQSVDSMDPNENCQNNNNYSNNNQLNNGYNIPPPAAGPILPYNQINPSISANPIHQMTQIYPSNAVSQTNPVNAMNTGIYPPVSNGGMGCAYHSNVQKNAILPPANPSFNGASDYYPGVRQYSEALPMPSAVQGSVNPMNQMIHYYQPA